MNGVPPPFRKPPYGYGSKKWYAQAFVGWKWIHTLLSIINCCGLLGLKKMFRPIATCSQEHNSRLNPLVNERNYEQITTLKRKSHINGPKVTIENRHFNREITHWWAMFNNKPFVYQNQGHARPDIPSRAAWQPWHWPRSLRAESYLLRAVSNFWIWQMTKLWNISL